jgi:N12 class adenine-specific DNA methylase
MADFDNEYYQNIQAKMKGGSLASLNDNDQTIIGDVVDTVQHGMYKGVAGVGESLGLESVRDWGQKGAQENRNSLSRTAKESLSKEFVSEDEQGNLIAGEGLTDWRTWALTTADMIGMNADLMVGGGAFKVGGMALTKIAKFTRSKFLSSGATKEVAEELAFNATKAYAKKHSKLRELSGDVAAYGGAAHLQYGGMQAIDMREEVEAMDFEDLADNKIFVDRARELQALNPQASRFDILKTAQSEMADEAANAVLANPALITSNVLLGGLGGKMLESLLRGGGNMVAKVAAEGITEGGQGAIEQYTSNVVGQEYIDENINATDGLLKSAANEAIAGAGAGAAFAGAGKVGDKIFGRDTTQGSAPTADEIIKRSGHEEQFKEVLNVDDKAAPVKTNELDVQGQEIRGKDWKNHYNRKEKIDKETGEVIQEPVTQEEKQDGPLTLKIKASAAEAKAKGEFFNHHKYDELLDAVAERKTEDEIKALASAVFVDPTKAHMKKSHEISQAKKAKDKKQAEHSQKVQLSNQRIWEEEERASMESSIFAEQAEYEQQEQVRGQQFADEAKVLLETDTQRRNDEDAHYDKRDRDNEVDGLQKDDDYDSALSEKVRVENNETKVADFNYQYAENEAEANPPAAEPEPLTFNNIGKRLKLKNKRKKFNKIAKIKGIPQALRDKVLAAIAVQTTAEQTEIADKLAEERTLAEKSKPIEEQADYTPNHAFADALMGFKPVKKFIDNLPTQEQAEVKQAITEAIAESVVEEQQTQSEPIKAFHGTGEKFNQFDNLKRGSFTGAESAKKGFFFTSNKGLADDFRREAERKTVDINGITKALSKLSPEKITRIYENVGLEDITPIDPDDMDGAVSDIISLLEEDLNVEILEERAGVASKIQQEIKGDFFNRGETKEVKLKLNNPLIVSFDPDSELDENAINKAIDSAEKAGNDGVIFKNMKDAAIVDEKGNGSVVSDVSFVFDAKQIESTKKSVDELANEAATSPTNDLPEPSHAQKEANNYKLGRVEHSGFSIGIENPKGSIRSGKGRGGKGWSNKINHHYGDITGTKGADGDALDVFVNPGTNTSDNVYVIDQVDPVTKIFDEHKVMFGFDSKESAEKAYLSNYDKDWQGVGAISEVALDTFKGWVEKGNTIQSYDKSLRQDRNSGKARSTSTPPQEQGLQPDSVVNNKTKKSKVIAHKKHLFTHKGTNFRLEEDLRENGLGENGGSLLRVTRSPTTPSEEPIYYPASLVKDGIEADTAAYKKLIADSEKNVLSVNDIASRLIMEKSFGGFDVDQDLGTTGKPSYAKIKNSDGVIVANITSAKVDYLDGFHQQVAEKLHSLINGKKTIPEQSTENVDKSISSPKAPKSKLDTAADAVHAKKIEKALKLKALIQSRKGRLNSNIDPEVMIAIAELGAISIVDGTLSFAKWVRDVLAVTKEVGLDDSDVKPFLKEAYGAIAANPEKYGVTDEQADELDNIRQVARMDIDSIIEEEVLAKAESQGVTVIRSSDDAVVNDSSAQDKKPVPDKVNSLNLEDYKKSVLVTGDTLPHKAALKNAKGIWNGKLKGWIFPQARKAEIEALLLTLNGQGESDAKTGNDNKLDSRSDTSKGISVDGKNGSDSKSSGRLPKSDSGTKPTGSDDSSKGNKRPNKNRASNGSSKQGNKRSDAVSNTRRDKQQGTNYRLGDSLNIASSPLQRATDNVEAIALAKAIQRENRAATPAEQATLAKYVGWGSSDIVNKLFPTKDNREDKWQSVYDALKERVSETELASINRTTQYAHYTPMPVIDAMYETLQQFGVVRGSAIEGGMGTGHFVGRHPSNMQLLHTGIEMDPISTLIGKGLYPQAGVLNADLTKVALPANHYDIAIGNPPFANQVIKNDKRYGKHGFMLHDYFMAKQIDAVKPGGFAAFVTSSGSMDKQDGKWRTYMEQRADLVGAIRLPNTAFKENAGTEVVTDILFFQRHPEGENTTGNGQAFMGLHELIGVNGNINEYFSRNPEMVLGKLANDTNQWGETLTVKSDGRDLNKALVDAMARLPKGIALEQPTIEQMNHEATLAELTPAAREYEIYLDAEGEIRQIADGVGVKMPLRRIDKRGLTKTQENIVRDYVDLKGATLALYKAQFEGVNWDKEQKSLHDSYDKFVAKHGAINQEKVINRTDGKNFSTYPVLSSFDLDPEAFRVAALEVEDSETGQWGKGEAFYERVFGGEKTKKIESAMDALMVSLNERGHVDLDFIKELYPDANEKSIISELGGAVFKEPLTGNLVTEDEYLSGNVKLKLAQAKAEFERDVSIRRNIEALEAVQPEPIEISLIPANLGAHWVPKQVVNNFAKKVLGFRGIITPVMQGASSSWNVSGRTPEGDFNTARRDSVSLLNSALNRKTVKVYDTQWVDGKEKQVLNSSETAAANQKVSEIRDAFTAWVKENADAANEVYDIYNRDFNTTVPRKYNGVHLTLPRLASRYKLRDWQLNVVWRILQQGNTYMAHGVGAGKTLASAVAGFELKRLGLANKPTYVVLKSTLKQFSAEMLDAYPDAKILVADEKKLDKKNRRRFMAQLTTENWDAVVMTHEAFERIPLSPEFMERKIQQEIESFQQIFDGLDEEDRVSRKSLERQIENLENKLEAAQSGSDKDEGFSFEETGIDFLFIDEAHIKHKKIPFPTEQSDVKGVDSQGSAKALDLYLKTRYLQEVRPNNNLVLMSGTPVTNTLGELFNIQRYLQEEVLEHNNISSFDSWSSTFAMSQTDLEMGADGTFKPVTRLNRFTGLPGLMRDFLQVADIITGDDIKNNTQVKLPDIKGGQPEIVGVPMTEVMKEYLGELSVRLSAIEERKGPPKKGDDIVPVVILDGELAAIDLRVVGRRQLGPSKLTVMIDRVFTSWESTRDKKYYSKGKLEPVTGGTQMIFSDIRFPSKSEFDIYEYIKADLVKRGVPANEIEFIQSANNDNKKRRLFKDMNQGRVRVLIGGTKNLGTGVNAQQRITDIHHLTTPYMPSELIQRDGRGVRAGNKNDEISIDRYATKGTVDAFKWQLLESKDRMINQVMGGNFDIHEVEDLGDSSSQLAMAKAIASGNPLLLESAGLEADVKKLQGMLDAHFNKTRKNKKELTDLVENVLPEVEKTVAAIEVSLQHKLVDTSGEKFTAKIGVKSFDERKAFGLHLFELAKQVGGKPEKVATVGGRPVFMSRGMASQVRVAMHLNAAPYKAENLISKRIRLEIDLRDVASAQLDASGFVRQIENQSRLLNDLPSMIEEGVESTMKKVDNLEKSLESQFQFADELKTKRERYSNVMDALAAGETSLDNDVVDTGEEFANIMAKDLSVNKSTKAEVEEYLTQFRAKYKGLLNIKSVKIYDSPSEVYSQEQLKQNPNRWRIAGSYNPKTDELRLYARNLSKSELANTIQHELFIHKGLGILQENEVTDLFARIQRTRESNNPNLQKIWKHIDAVYGNDHQDVQAEEFLANLAGNISEKTLDNKSIPHSLARALDKIGLFLWKLFKKLHLVKNPKRTPTQTELTDYVINLANAFKKGAEPSPRGGKKRPPEKGSDGGQDFHNILSSDALSKIGMQSPSTTLTAMKNILGNKLSDTRKHWLGALPRRYLADIAGNLIPSIKTYMGQAAQLDADRTDLLTHSAEVVDAWREANGKTPEQAQALADLMHEATQEGVDPSKGYEALRDLAGFGPNQKRDSESEMFGEVLTQELVNKRIKEIKEQIRGRSGENTAKFMQRIDDIKSRWQFEQNRAKAYPALAEKFNALPDDMKAMFSKVSKHYAFHRKEEMKALLQRIQELKVNEKQKAALRDQIRLQFESNKVEFYFPLQRFGEYFVRVTDGQPDKDGNEETVVFEMFETEFAQQKFIAEQQKEFAPGQIKSGKNLQDAAALDQVSGGFVTDVVALLEPMGSMGDEIADQVYQMYLKRLPALSGRKRKIHRKGVAGFHDDALRGFAHNMFHSAYQISKLRHSESMQTSLENMEGEANELNGKEHNKAKDLVGEMIKRHDWIMNPQGGALANKLTSLGFAWYLGVTPAAAAVNFVQTPMLALPIIGSRFGFTKAASAIVHYSSLFVKSGHVEKTLTGEELEAFEAFKKSGLIDKTQTHDLAGVAEGGLEYNSNWYKVMKGVGYLFHHAERFNREVTSMAAYKVAKESGESHEKAIKTATDLTFEAHFDYSNGNKARFMQSDVMKVAFIFRQHSVNMTYRLWRDFHQMFKGESKEVRSQARKQFSGIIGMTGLFAGATGMPLYSLLGNMVEILFDDEDEPWEFNTEFRNFLAEHLGVDGGRIAANGLVDYLTGATVSGRVGMNNLWIRDSNRDMDGKETVLHYAESALGAVFGLTISAGRGLDYMQQGQVYRGIEAMLPKAAKDALKSYRYAQEGVQTLKGDNIVDELNNADIVKQLLGFTPSVVSEQYERNSAMKGPEVKLKRRRSLLMNRWALAMRLQDRDFINDAQKDINRFNKMNPQLVIADKHKLLSLRGRKRKLDESVDGVIIDSRLQNLRDVVVF